VQFAFGAFVLDDGRFELRHQGDPVKLEPKVFDVLRFLVQHRERVVPREELLGTLWPDEHVVDAVVTRCVYEIRRVLGRDRGGAKPIETVRGRGYRFALEVRVVAAEEAARDEAPFVGRSVELRQLDAGFAGATKGNGRVALLVGEAGVGKTRIAEEFAERVRSAGHVVWTARCHEDRGAPPFWLWAQVARRCLRELGEASVLADGGPSHRELAALLPELADARGTGEPEDARPGDAAHYRRFDAVTRLLRAATADRCHLLVLDDLHWADLPSLQLLGFMMAEIVDRRLFVLGTCRNTDWAPDDPGKGVVDGFGRHANFERIPVAPLSAADVDDYVSRRVGARRPALSRELHRISEGNPFFMVEALAPAMAGGAGQPTFELSDTGRDLVRRRLALLAPEARSLLEAAAVIGTEFDVGLLASVTGRDSVAVLEALQHALHVHLLAAVQEGAARLRFAHGLIRETAYADVPLARRSQLHAEVASRLECVQPPPLGELARHAHRALPVGDAARAVRWARAAGEEATAACAHHAAITHYAQALDALRALPSGDAVARQEVLRALAEAQHLAGRTDAAQVTFREAAALARSAHDVRALALAVIGLRDCQALRAVPDAAIESELRDALARVPVEETGLRARLVSRLAAVRAIDARREASRLAEELARGIDDPIVLADVWHARLHALQGPDEIEQRLDAADHLIALSDAHRRPSWAWEAWLARYDARLRLGEVAVADQALSACAALAERLRHPRLRLDHARLSAQRAVCEGRYADAEREILRNAETAQRLSDPFAQYSFLVQMFWLLRDRGLLGSLGDQGEQFIRARPWVEPSARATVGLMYVEQGNLDAARRCVDYYARDRFQNVPYGENFLSVLAQLATICDGLGASEHASRLYGLLLPYADQNVVNGTSACFGSAAHFLGLLAGLMGDHDAAYEHFERAMATSDAMGLRPAAVRTRLAYARLIAHEQPARARELRGAAEAAAAAIGMVVPRQT
jgi:DNA-binding winged helix-turn-helix (wHTH) protein/tetratricopeptide (TPR) repeat protein